MTKLHVTIGWLAAVVLVLAYVQGAACQVDTTVGADPQALATEVQVLATPLPEQPAATAAAAPAGEVDPIAAAAASAAAAAGTAPVVTQPDVSTGVPAEVATPEPVVAAPLPTPLPQEAAAAAAGALSVEPNTAPVPVARKTRRRRRAAAPQLSGGVTAAALAGCTWPGHCLGDPCRTNDGCDQDWICVNSKCAVKGTSPPPPTPPPPPPSGGTSCTWPGHCLGDSCRTNDDCDQDWICVSSKCAVKGASPPPPTPPPTPPSSGTSYPATLTAYNVMTGDNTKPGDLYVGSVSQNFVSNINIVAVHSKFWATYGYTQVDITYNGRTGRFFVLDLCADTDCGGCCTANMNWNNNGFLLDIDASAARRVFNIADAQNTLKASATFKQVPNSRIDFAALQRMYP